MLALDRLDGESCRATLDELGNEPGTAELWAFVVYLRGQHGLHYDDPAASLAVFDTAQDALPPVIANTEVARLLLARCRADLLLAAGKGHHALNVLANHSSEQIPTLAVPLARLHLLAGHPSEAFRIATNLVWSPTTDNRSRQELLLINALAAHRMGETSTSARLARQALGLYRHTRTLAAFTVLDDDDLDLLLETAAGTAQYKEIAAIRDQRRPYPNAEGFRRVAREQVKTRERDRQRRNLFAGMHSSVVPGSFPSSSRVARQDSPSRRSNASMPRARNAPVSVANWPPAWSAAALGHRVSQCSAAVGWAVRE
jgi:hypothetical protein